MKIAVIGSGVSGLVSAYLLSKDHEVVVYEKADRIGGHAHTLIVKENSQSIPVDNGFMVFNPEKYPNFVKLLEELQVEYLTTNMSFAVTIPGQIAYKGSFPKGIFALRKNIFNFRYLLFLFEIYRFRRLAKQSLKKQMHKNETLGAFIHRNGLSVDLQNWFLYPMLSAIWSIKKTGLVGSFPALATFTFLNNHRLLNFTQPKWRTIKGGSIQYVSRVEKYIVDHGGKIHLRANITKIVRNSKSVLITVNDTVEKFDYVLFATHADVTKKLITDITDNEKSALDMFTYTSNTTYLHKQTSLVPHNKALLAAWNYTQAKKTLENATQAIFTYSMNILQHIDASIPVFVTLNPNEKIRPDKLYFKEEYAHPQYNLASLKGQTLIGKLQGERRTLYAGAYLGYGFHEDGVVSAINAVKYLGIKPSWI